MKHPQAVLLLLFLVPHYSAADTSREQVALFARSDPRLSAGVDISDADICVGDLLDRATAQSGVLLRCGRDDGSADVRISAICHKVALKDLLSSLQALLSHREAEVYWQRLGKASPYSYELRFPLTARRLPGRLREETQTAFEKAAEVMLRLAAMEPSERAKHAGEISRSHLQKDDHLGKSVLSQERTWSGLNLFSRSLTRQQQQDVLSGHSKIDVQVADLAPADRAFVQSEFKRDGSGSIVRDRNGSSNPVAPPTSIMFTAPRDQGDITRTLFVHLDTTGGYGYVGGSPLENAFIRKVHDLWMMPGESADVPPGIAIAAEDGQKPEAPPFSDTAQRESRLSVGMPPLFKRLSEFSQRANVAVMGRIDVVLGEELGDVGQSVSDFLDRLANYGKGLSVKWSGRTMLIEEPQWFWTEEDQPPWAAITWFRHMMAERKDIPQFEDLCAVTRWFTAAQLAKTNSECAWLPGLADLWPLLNACRDRQALRTGIMSDAGLKLTPEVRSIIQQSRSLTPVLSRPEARAIQMKVASWQAPGDSAATSLMLDIGTVWNDGTRHGLFGLRIRPPRRPQKPQ